MAATPDLPLFADRAEAPRDLRTADELAARGLTKLGAAIAWFANGNGPPVALFSTSEARRLRDGMWPTPRSRAKPEVAQGGAPQGEPLPRDPALVPGIPVRRAAAPLDWIARLFDEPFVVLDTETTGLGARAEIIEVGVVGADGRTLFESLVWPKAEHVPLEASRIHGLHLPDLEGAPSWPSVVAELEELLRGHRIVAWNAPFDERMARQSSRAWRVVHRLPGFECAMRGYAHASGVASGSMRLERAAQVEGVLRSGQKHRSADDARLTLAVLRRALERRRVRA